jgi:putative Mg2+ transporter-C (MgtC) family protein
MIELPVALLRLTMAVLLGAFVGVEREWRHKAAGIKTNALVALGAAGFAMMSNTFGPANHNPAQIAAAVVSGIGFIGAGVIIHRGATVQGVTTAATLWANASMGVAVGLGQYAIAAIVFAGLIFVQFTMRHAGMVMTRMRRDHVARFEVRVECDAAALASVNDSCQRYADTGNVIAVRRNVSRGPEFLTWRALFRTTGTSPHDFTKFEEELVALAGVRSVQLRHIGLDDE